MGTVADEGEVIILSDDDCEDDSSNAEPSVFIVDVEDVKNKDCVLSPSQLDEDLVVTFSRRAEVLPHARYDCPINPFTATDHDTTQPVAGNQLICDQCFCYICDKLASSCEVWSQGGVCHCNSHKKSEFWSNLRNGALLGGLRLFNITLTEIDAHLRHAETMLQSFRKELVAKFTSFLMGEAAAECGVTQTNQQGLVHDYTPVYECVSSFLNEADNQDHRAAAIMRLGAVENFIRHFQVSGTVSQSPMADVAQAKVLLIKRVVSSVQRQMVMSNFTPEFTQKLQNFYKKFCLSPELKNMNSSLCVRHWDDVLLVSVLKGQNVWGVRKDKGKKDVLIEQISVVLLRMELLQCQHRFRELCRYLRVVQSDDAKTFQQVKDLIPFFLCKDGEFYRALSSLCPLNSGTASRFTPQLFHLYLRIFETATTPSVTAYSPAQLCSPNVTWEPVKDAVPVKREELVKFALRVQKYCKHIYINVQCWTSLLTLVNTAHGSSSGLPEPSPVFLQAAKIAVMSILQHPNNIYIPRFFLEEYPDQALLLLVTAALNLRILDTALSPVLPVLCAFKKNVWALVWLLDNLSSHTDCFNAFLQQIAQEKENIGDRDDVASFLQSLVLAAPGSSANQDQQFFPGNASITVSID